MRRRFVVVTALVSAGLLAHGQEPPRLLPSSITGARTPPDPTVRPASDTQAPPAAPITRFHDPRAFPPETVVTLTGAKAAAEWLWRMNQPDGRFLPGLHPTTRSLVAVDDDVQQAVAALALAEAARFTGDDRYAARATQATMTLLARTRPDATDPTRRVPMSDRNRVGVAALLVLTVIQLPEAGPTLLRQADELCTYLRSQCQPDGSVQVGVGDDVASVGLAVQAIVLSNRVKPESWKRDSVSKAVGFYRSALKGRPDPRLAATLIPGCVDFALQPNGDRSTMTAVFEWADTLCEQQVVRIDPRNPAWTGGFRLTADGGPTHESAVAVVALAHAAKLTRHVPDLTRFHRYRASAVAGLTFVGNLQHADETHRDGFETRYLAGGVRVSPADPTIRAEAAAHFARAGLAFLQSGAEGRVD